MQPLEKPKRRMVVYITEETYSNLQNIAEAENRSVSNVAEGKIMLGLRAGPDRTGQSRLESAQLKPDPTGSGVEDLKGSVIEVIENLPSESLEHLAEKLARILDRSIPVQTGQDQTVPIKAGSIAAIVEEMGDLPDMEEIERKKEIIKDIAVRLSEFVQKHHISQRMFKKKYGFDITSLRFWISGQRGMSFEMIARIEKILSSNPVSV